MHSDAGARNSHVTRPAKRGGHLDGNARRHRRRQDGIAVGLVLPFEQFPRRHADDARVDSLFRKLFERVHAEINFAACREQKHVGFASRSDRPARKRRAQVRQRGGISSGRAWEAPGA